MATLEESIDIGCPVNMTQDDLQMRIQILTATPPPGRGGEAIWDTSGSSTPPRTGEPQMKYRRIASSERYAIAALRRQGLSLSAILSLIHISEPTRLGMISYAVFCLKKKKKKKTYKGIR